jgi:hypothetical protein
MLRKDDRGQGLKQGEHLGVIVIVKWEMIVIGTHWYTGKCLQTLRGRKSLYWFPWWKYLHHDEFKTPIVLSLNVGKAVYMSFYELVQTNYYTPLTEIGCPLACSACRGYLVLSLFSSVGGIFTTFLEKKGRRLSGKVSVCKVRCVGVLQNKVRCWKHHRNSGLSDPL